MNTSISAKRRHTGLTHDPKRVISQAIRPDGLWMQFIGGQIRSLVLDAIEAEQEACLKICEQAKDPEDAARKIRRRMNSLRK